MTLGRFSRTVKGHFLFFQRQASRLWKKGLRPVAAHALFQCARLQAEKSFLARTCRARKRISIYFVATATKLYEVLLCVPGRRAVFLSTPPEKMGKEKGRSHDRRTRIVYQISFCLVNSIPWNQPIFSRLPNSESVILYNFPTCKPPFVVLLYSQKRKTGENLKAQRRRNELLTVTRFHRKIFPHPGDLP